MSGILTSAIGTLIIIFLVYAFQGVISFIPYLLGLLMNFLYYPVEFISQVIYPVGTIVYLTYTGLVFGLVIKLIIDLFSHRN